MPTLCHLLGVTSQVSCRTDGTMTTSILPMPWLLPGFLWMGGCSLCPSQWVGKGLLALVLLYPVRAVLQTTSCAWSEVVGFLAFSSHLVFPPRPVMV